MALTSRRWDHVDVLGSAQLDDFRNDGFVVVPGVVSEHLLGPVDREFDRLLEKDPPTSGTVGKHFYFLAPEHLPAADAALHDSGGLAAAEQLTAPHRLEHGFGHIQLALNIPSWDHVPGGPHLDGYHDPDRPHSFTLLACIFLGDETEPGRGNLWVWPGSHHRHSELFRTEGVTALMATSGHAAPDGWGDPVPILAKRGDLLLAHYLLGHNSGGNTSSETRRAVYYRLACAGHEERWDRTFVDPFLEFKALSPEI